MADVPMMPVNAFKKYELRSIGEEKIFKILTSSGTSGQRTSKIYLDEETAARQQQTLFRILEERLERREPFSESIRRTAGADFRMYLSGVRMRSPSCQHLF